MALTIKELEGIVEKLMELPDSHHGIYTFALEQFMHEARKLEAEKERIARVKRKWHYEGLSDLK